MKHTAPVPLKASTGIEPRYRSGYYVEAYFDAYGSLDGTPSRFSQREGYNRDGEAEYELEYGTEEEQNATTTATSTK